MSIRIPNHVSNGGFIPEQSLLRKINSALSDFPKTTLADPKTLTRKIKDTQPTASTLAAVNDHLIPVSSDLTADEQFMLTTTVLWIQHTLQGYCTGSISSGCLGWSIDKFSDPDVRNSEEFYKAVIYTISNWCGWAANSGSFNTTYHDKTHKGNLDIISIVRTVLSAVAAPGTAEMLAIGAQEIVSQDQDTGVSNVGNFFWNEKYHHQSKCQFVVTPAIKNVEYYVDYAYLITYESITQDDWRTLFIQNSYEEFIFSASSVQLRLSLDQWNIVKSDVCDRLSKWLTDQVKHAPLS